MLGNVIHNNMFDSWIFYKYIILQLLKFKQAKHFTDVKDYMENKLLNK